MAVACSIFGHKWKGCICDRCGEKRDQEHDYRNFKASYEKFGCGKCVGTCKCGKIQELDHDWNGCTCRRCGFRRDENHKWSGNTCAICGLPLKDSLEYYRRMIDDKK